MKLNKGIIFLVFSVMALSLPSFGQSDTSSDNTKINKRDRFANELTSDQQKFSDTDTKITARIRQDIMKEKNLSTYGQNIKIITVNGKVTLKGPVHSQSEQSSILKCARSVAGASNVINEITITPNKTN